MARLNTRVSHQPSSSPTSPIGNSSDQENHDPMAPRRDKGKQRAIEPSPRPSLPTPSSQDSNDARGQKRRRATTPPARQARERPTTPTAAQEDEDEEEDEPQSIKKLKKYYDPNQDAGERREVKRGFRELQRDVLENRDDLLRESDGLGIQTSLAQANRMFKSVKQTNDATIDSNVLLSISELVSKRSRQLVLGDASIGVDVDEFFSKCITYMRNDGILNPEGDDTQAGARQRRRSGHQGDDELHDDDDEEAQETLNLPVLGEYGCVPFNSRPAVRGFLLGPLSVEKKQRKETQRRARNARDAAGREVNPEELTQENLQQSDEKGLTAICTRIYTNLEQHCAYLKQSLRDAGLTTHEQLASAEAQELVERLNRDNTGAYTPIGVSLFHFAMNPHSFGQSVENLFYVSFLIKDGHIGLAIDSEGRVSIKMANDKDEEQEHAQQPRRSDAKKHQAVFSLDYATWEKLIEAFGIEEPMIPHRDEDDAAQQLQQTGWYN